jgi:hypothetical protein
MPDTLTKLTIAIALAVGGISLLFLVFGSKEIRADGWQERQPSASNARPGQVGALAALTTTVQDFFLPGTQPGQLTDTITIPASCDTCHTEPIYNRWRGSMMSQSGRDPLMWAALAIANQDAPGAGEYCLRCHVSKGWLEGRSDPHDGSALQPADLEAGVACETCHRLVDAIASPDDEAKDIDAAIRSQLALSGTLPLTTHQGSAMMIVDPADRRRGPFDVSPPHGALQTDLMAQTSDSVTRSRLCGTCHNVDNPALSWNNNPPGGGPPQFWPNSFNQPAPSFAKGKLFPLERTFDEWLNSQYATTGVFAPQFAGEKPDGIVGACQDCHMPRLTGVAADLANPVFRDCQPEPTGTGCLPEHEFVGGNAWVPQILQDTRWRLNSAADAAELNTTVVRARQFLQKAATMTATLTLSGPTKIATVRVVNQTGHKLPTGYPEGRRMWLNLKAYDGSNKLVYQSGAYNSNTAALTKDTAIKIYEVKLGLTPELATVAGLPAGESFHFVLNNTVIKDNRIPPRGYTQAAFNQPGLRPVGAVYANGQYWDETVYTVPSNTRRIVATLYYQTSSKEYIDFLRTNGGADGATLGQLWDDLKSPPEKVATASASILTTMTYLPIVFK